MLGAQIAKVVLNVGSVAILARLIAPSDFGLIAMVTALTGFVTMFKDAGLSMATVQRRDITREQVSTLFWINVALSGATMVVVVAIAPAIAWFYGEPRLVWIAVALAGTFLFGGLTVQHQALLTRQMRFSALAAIAIVSMAGGSIASIIAALLGFGYWSLVIQIAATAAVNAIGVWFACGWRPGRPVRGSGVRQMLAFGGNLTGFNVINYLARNVDNILIGWYWGAGPLGFYSKAYQLLLLPISQVSSPISAVALPTLSRLQEQPDRFKRYYLQAIGALTFVGMPVVAFLVVDARDVVLLVLGGTWLPAVPIFQALGFAAFLGTFNVAAGWAYAALDRTNRQLRWQLIATPIIIAAFLLGLPWGAIGVAVGYSVVSLLLRPFTLWYCYRGTFLRLKDVLLVLIRPASISIFAALCVFLLDRILLLSVHAPFVRLFLGATMYLVAYVVGWMSTAGVRREFASMIALGSSILPSNR